MADQTNMLYADNTVPLTEIGNIEVSLNSIRALTFRCIAIPEENKFDILRLETEVTNIDNNISLLKTASLNSEQSERFQTFLTQWGNYNSTVNRFLTNLVDNKIDSPAFLPSLSKESSDISSVNLATHSWLLLR